MLKSMSIQMKLRYIWFLFIALVSQETVKCCGCGEQHHRRNKCDNTFSAFCSEECFAHTARDHMKRDLFGAYEGPSSE